MKSFIGGLYITLLFVLTTKLYAQVPGAEEFGLTKKQLAQNINKVEILISNCMRAHGFHYIAADYVTIRRGMSADKNLPGRTEQEFIQEYGYGISTLYTGIAPQLATGYSPATVGLGQRNSDIFLHLSHANQVAYNRKLLGEYIGMTFAVTLEAENFSRTGGCTREAIVQVFKPDELQASYYNPKDILFNKDPRMKTALKKYATEMRNSGFDYNHPDEVELDIERRLALITNGGTIPLTSLSPKKATELKSLQKFEREVTQKSFELEDRYIEPIDEKLENELYSRQSE